MAVWSSRSTGYKVGVLFMLLGCAFYLIGYAAPFWIQHSSHEFAGLWMGCSGDPLGPGIVCGNLVNSDSAGWLLAVQAIETVALIGLFITFLYSIITNCCRSTTPYNRRLEILCFVFSLCGFIGCMVFVGKTAEFFSDQYGWALGLNLTGCILLLLCSIVIAVSNRQVLDTPTTDRTEGVTMVVSQQGHPTQTGYYPGTAQYPAGNVPS